MNNDYSDIWELPHPDSLRYKRMSLEARAAQFAPFAALNGFDSAIEETGRQTDAWHAMEEADLSILNQSLTQSMHRTVIVTYFVPDIKKSGGQYYQVTGTVKRIDTDSRILHFKDGHSIPLDSITNMEL